MEIHDAFPQNTCQEAPQQPRRKPETGFKTKPYRQAVAIQLKLTEAIVNNQVAPSGLSDLSRAWLDLEKFKRSIRAPKVPKLAPKSAGNPDSAPFDEEEPGTTKTDG